MTLGDKINCLIKKTPTFLDDLVEFNCPEELVQSYYSEISTLSNDVLSGLRRIKLGEDEKKTSKFYEYYKEELDGVYSSEIDSTYQSIVKYKSVWLDQNKMRTEQEIIGNIILELEPKNEYKDRTLSDQYFCSVIKLLKEIITSLNEFIQEESQLANSTKRTEGALTYAHSLIMLELLMKHKIIKDLDSTYHPILSLIVGQKSPKDLYQNVSKKHRRYLRLLRDLTDGQKPYYRSILRDIMNMMSSLDQRELVPVREEVEELLRKIS